MATKVYCDRCKCEIDINSNGYRRMYFMFGRDDDVEDYDFCEDCFTSVKRSIVQNLVDYEKPALKDQTDGSGYQEILYHHLCKRCHHDWWSNEAFPNRCKQCNGIMT